MPKAAQVFGLPQKELFLRIGRLTGCEHILIKVPLLNINDDCRHDFALSSKD